MTGRTDMWGYHRGGRPALRWVGVVLLVGAVAALVGPVTPAKAAPEECAPAAPGQPMFITESCVDPYYRDAAAVILVSEVRDTPVPHRFVEGTFTGTNGTFAFYFPAPERYEGRFFQGPVHQLRLTGEVASEEEMEFAFDSGGYLIEVNPGGDNCLVPRHCTSGRFDTTLRGYRLNAAAAKYSRTVATDVYGFDHRPFGYLWGGSGGAYMTLSAAEQSTGVWDGFVPFVMGHPHAIPNNGTVLAHALRVLRARPEALPSIADALDAGGSGNPYAALTKDEADALREATRMGFPLQGWIRHQALSTALIDIIGEYVPIADPTYTDDFWTKPGYLGTERSSAGTAVRAARIQHRTKVVASTPLTEEPPYQQLGPAYLPYGLSQLLVGPPGKVVLGSLPEGDFTGADLVFTTGANAGKRLPISSPDRATNSVSFGPSADWDIARAIRPGDEVMIDNSMTLARQTVHRHQAVSKDLYGFDQFRKPRFAKRYDAQGRPILIGPVANLGASGSLPTGRFHGKMIMAQSLWDTDAFVWGGDWYREQAISKLGEQHVDGNFRIWMQDHARHDPGPITGQEAAYLASHMGVLQQALRDVAAWAEKGIEPPASTSYSIDRDTQVHVPATAAQRRGVQPVVHLTANGTRRTVIAPGGTVTLTATIEVPPGTGTVIRAEIDPEGDGTFTTIPIRAGQRTVTITTTVTYTESGTYFPVARATSQRNGVTDVAFAQPMNLDRARVVVGDGISPPDDAPGEQICPLPNQAPNGQDLGDTCIPAPGAP